MVRTIQDETLSAIAHAIRTRADTEDALTPLEMPDAISGIKDTSIKKLLEGTLPVLDSDASKIPPYICSDSTALERVDMPNLDIVSDYAFYQCSGLKDVNLPQAISVNAYAFYRCGALEELSLPNATSIGSYGFRYCTKLREFSAPKMKSLAVYAFERCSALENVSFPELETIGGYAFAYAAIREASFPNVTSVGQYAFSYCSNLDIIDIPLGSACGGVARDSAARFIRFLGNKASTALSSAFRNCSKLEVVELGVSAVKDYTFAYCTSLRAIVLRYDGVVSGANSYTLQNVNPDAIIYVPDAHLNTYRSTTPLGTQLSAEHYHPLSEWDEMGGWEAAIGQY